jgi:succinate dehydrogenase / fumarate reductase iron-sulfur subunit
LNAPHQRATRTGIKTTDNAIIPLKKRVVGEFFDPVKRLIQLVVRKRT